LVNSLAAENTGLVDIDEVIEMPEGGGSGGLIIGGQLTIFARYRYQADSRARGVRAAVGEETEVAGWGW